MANVRIDNFSGDTVTVIFDGVSQTVEDDSRVTFDAFEKGKHTLRIHRTRVPLESADGYSEQEKSFQEQLEDKDRSMHTHLDYVCVLDINSSKSVVTVKPDVTAKEGRGLDAVFSSYALTLTGAKEEKGHKIFANSSVRKRFISYHIKNAMLPTGVCGAAVLFLALTALFAALAGKPVDLGGTVFTLPWAAGLTAVAVAVCLYTVFCIVTIMKTAKILRE